MTFLACFAGGPRRRGPRRRLAQGLLGLACWCLGSAAPAAAAPAADGGAATYATRLPGPAGLEFELRYGFLSGSGRLDWQPPKDGRYRAQLVGSALGMTLLSWVSEGGVDAAGLAPRRFAERRLKRAEETVEFERTTGRIRYLKQPPVEWPLPVGAQDRLSWMLQLPAILEANPALRRPGSEITLPVTGSRGGAVPWTFVVQGREPLTLIDGRVADALHLRRAPRPGSEVSGEAWLDPAREHLPVRVRLSSADGGNALELRLRGMHLP